VETATKDRLNMRLGWVFSPMLRRCPCVLLLTTVGWALTAASAVAQQQTQRLPTATEVFNLRSKCAALGDRLLEETTIGIALTKSQVSHYEPRTNRCYVELTIQTADLSKPIDQHYHHRVLYDGQTKEMLASAQIERGKKSGMVFDKQHRATTLTNAGWDDAGAYIDAMMADDRK
jgi:hypothetical protein